MSLIKKIFDYFVWLIFFAFLLLGIFVYLLNNARKGDYLYSAKLYFERFIVNFK